MKLAHLTFQALTALLLLAGPLEAAQYHFSNQTFTVPDGFVLEQVAGPPLVARPISGSFDERGRLYVTDSSGSNDKVQKQLEEKPHRIRRLEAADAQGRFNKSTLFAEHMMFPEGCLWFDGSLYVSAPPSIWKLTDTNNDGIADTRSEWHDGKTLTGCANDLHGPYLGLDGWIYWCKGAFAKQTYERPGRKPIVTRASHIFRAPPDHSDLEPVLTAGMDNPVGVVFTLQGERFMCGTFLMHPEAGKRDGVVHAVYGGVYGKPNDVLDDQKKTGPLMPVMTHLGAAAPCSVIRYDSDSFGADYENNLFVCSFNLHKVTRHVLVPDGATFKTVDSDFLVSDSTDFHPTDVIEDADGSLLVIDTGGWYKLCCPTSQLSKPDVLGAIYRIRRMDAPPIQDPRGLALAWNELTPEQLAALLQDGRPAVRARAVAQLAEKGKTAVPVLANALKTNPSARARAYLVWSLTRIPDPSARVAVEIALNDPTELVRHAAILSTALWRDTGSVEQLLSILQVPAPQLQRAAAEALGRIGTDLRMSPGAGGAANLVRSIVPALLNVAGQPHDRFLEHSLIFALIEIADPSATAAGLKSKNSHQLKAALIALDQMDGGGLQPSAIIPLLDDADEELRETALWIADHHPGWGAELAGYFKKRLDEPDLTATQGDELQRQLTQFVSATPIQELIAAGLSSPSATELVRQILLETVSGASLKEPPPAWLAGVLASLNAKDPTTLHSAISAARALSRSKTENTDLPTALLHIAHEASLPADLRLEALGARPESGPLDSESLDLACSNLDPGKPVLTRAAAAGVLGKAKLSSDQLLRLAPVLKNVGPLELTTLLQAFAESNDEAVGAELVSALQESKGLTSLRPDTLEKVLSRFPPSVQASGKQLLASLEADTAKEKAHLNELLASLGKGDVRRGQAIFNSPRAACSSCHAMGYLGGHVGPDLTTIGQVRTERDLLESIIYPSASFVRSFEPYIIKTKSDEDYSGVLKKDAPDEVVLATGPSTEVRIPRADIVDLRPGTVSVMPAGLEQQLTHQELADLIAFLKGTKWGAN